MTGKYTAKIYLEKDVVAEKSGDNADDLQTWMLTEAEGQMGNVHGEVINTHTKEVVKKFRKAPPD